MGIEWELNPTMVLTAHLGTSLLTIPRMEKVEIVCYLDLTKLLLAVGLKNLATSQLHVISAVSQVSIYISINACRNHKCRGLESWPFSPL